MHFIPQNIRFLRKQKGWTQEELARQLGVKRSLIGAYEEGRADPRISFMQLVCVKFNLDLDAFITMDLENDEGSSPDIEGKALRILPITVRQEDDRETTTIVPVKAAAGYLNGYGDVEFIEALPTFAMPYPELPQDRTYRVVQIQGDSMIPIPSGSYIMGTYIQNWNEIKNDQLYIIVSRSEGIVFKRVLNNIMDGVLTLKSDNPSFDTYNVKLQDVIEVWKAVGMTLLDLDFNGNFSAPQSTEELKEIQDRLSRIEGKLK